MADTTITEKAREVLADMQRCHHVAVKDALIYLGGGEAALAAAHERRKLDKSAASRARTAMVRVWPNYGMNEVVRHDDTDETHRARIELKNEVRRLLIAQTDADDVARAPESRLTTQAREVIADKTFTRTMRDRVRALARGYNWAPRGASECRMGRTMHERNLIYRDGRFYRLTAGSDGLGAEVARLLLAEGNS